MVFQKGHKVSEESIKKLLEFNRINGVWNKGTIIDRNKFPNMGHFKKHNEESKKKSSETHKRLFLEGKLKTRKGQHNSKEHRKMHSETMKRLYSEGKIINNRKGIKLSEETINKMLETRKKHGGYASGENHPMFGKHTIAWNKGTKGVCKAWNKGKIGITKSNKKGKTYEEIYGKEKADSYKVLIKKARTNQIFPIKDSLIEVKIQGFLKELGISFFTHQHITEIEHGYQCDIFIPSLNLVIECDGDYWHKYPTGRDIDKIRTSELIEKGFKVLRLWERDIKILDIDKFDFLLNGGQERL